MTAQRIYHHQPDDPGPGVCPTCGCKCHDGNASARKLLKLNAGHVSAIELADVLSWPLARLIRFARDEGFDLRCAPAYERDATRRRA